MVFGTKKHHDTNMDTSQTPDPSSRLRIATRIHFALLRQYGEAVEVDSLLKYDADAREAVWVCQASGDAELVSLARQFTQASSTRSERSQRKPNAAAVTPSVAPARPAAASPARPAPQDAAWARNTSGFGVSQPAELADAPLRKSAGGRWFKPMQWLRSGGTGPSR